MKQTQSKTKSYTRRYTSEDENFWRQHIATFSEGRVSRRNYCKKNGINYDRFNYWIRKLSPTINLMKPQPANLEITPPKLLPVQLKSLPESKDQALPVLGTLNLKNGAKLHIHHEQALSLILEKWGELC
jgi:hypothetical protein